MYEREIEALKKLYLFREVPASALAELCMLAPPVRHKRGDVVFREGERADAALLVVEGLLQAQIETEDGPHAVGEVHTGEIVGEQALFSFGGLRNATVIAMEDVSALLITPDAIHSGARNPAIIALELQLIGTLTRRIRKINRAIQKIWHDHPTGDSQEVGQSPVRHRLARLFSGLARRSR